MRANQFLQSDRRELKSLFARIRVLDKLNQAIKPFLGEQLAPYCQVINQTATTITLLVANGSIATQIRFQAADIIRKLKQDETFALLQRIECKVRPVNLNTDLSTVQAALKKKPTLSAEAAALMRDIADSMEDERLREVLNRIASHVKA